MSDEFKEDDGTCKFCLYRNGGHPWIDDVTPCPVQRIEDQGAEIERLRAALEKNREFIDALLIQRRGGGLCVGVISRDTTIHPTGGPLREWLDACDEVEGVDLDARTRALNYLNEVGDALRKHGEINVREMLPDPDAPPSGESD